MDAHNLDVLINRAVDARSTLLDEDHTVAIRLFNGFYEGCPDLVVDLYARTLVLYSYMITPEIARETLMSVQTLLLARLPWVNCVVQKIRSADDDKLRRGLVTFGDAPDCQAQEHGVWYALDLMMNQDASLYLDTRNLRQWLLTNAAEWMVLNTFAYTGSLGVAGLAGGAIRVVQVDLSRKFLALARQSCALNHLDAGKMELRVANFFIEVVRFKRSGELFDCVIADPPFFSSTEKGTINLVGESTRVINKLRPLVKDGGRLVVINNALFLSGADYLHSLELLCDDGYMTIEALVPVPPDFTGYPHTITAHTPVDPSPFNHPTKITILKLRRKAA